MTLYDDRVLLIVPAARVAAVVAWIQANIDPSCPANLGPGLCAAGDATKTVTHRWQSAAWADADARQLLARMCHIASVTPPGPAQWRGWTLAQKRSWLAGVRAAVLAASGIYAQFSDGPGDWDSPPDALAALGLAGAE